MVTLNLYAKLLAKNLGGCYQKTVSIWVLGHYEIDKMSLCVPTAWVGSYGGNMFIKLSHQKLTFTLQ